MADQFPKNLKQFNNEISFDINFENTFKWQLAFVNLEYIPFMILLKIDHLDNAYKIHFKSYGYEFYVKEIHYFNTYRNKNIYKIVLTDEEIQEEATIIIPHNETEKFGYIFPSFEFNKEYDIQAHSTHTNLRDLYTNEPYMMDVQQITCCPGGTCVELK